MEEAYNLADTLGQDDCRLRWPAFSPSARLRVPRCLPSRLEDPMFPRVTTMVGDQLRTSTVASALGDVLGDLTDLVQKEMRLGQAELSANLSAKLEGGVWLGAAAALVGVAFLLVVQAAVFVIASYGVPMHWSCLIAAGVVSLVAVLAYLIGRQDASVALMPRRTIHQIQQDVILSKEQLT